MPAVVKEVECSIEDFSDDELISEIEWRDLQDAFINETHLEDYSDDDLINELESRNFVIVGKSKDPIFKLYRTYLTMSPEFFKKELEQFFKDNI